MKLDLELSAPLPEKWIPLETVSIIKCLDEDGDPALCYRTSGGLTSWESVGMLISCLDALREDIKRNLTDPPTPSDDS